MGRAVIRFVRIGVPLLIAAAGVALIVLGHASLSEQSTSRALQSGVGVGLVIVAIIVWMINWMFRMSVESNRERDAEEQAREYFDRHGHWPDEEPMTRTGSGAGPDEAPR